MPLRSRPDGSAAASRVAALLPLREGGWVPPVETPSPVEAGAQRSVEPPVSPGPSVVPAVLSGPVADHAAPPDSSAQALPRRGPHPVEAADELRAARSWTSREPGAHVAAAGRWRLDPGRRGAVALVLVALVAALIAGALTLRNRPQEVPLPVVEAGGIPLPGTSAPPSAGAEVVVAVGGKVRKPGLFRLPAGSRVDDAVRAAGGPVSRVDVSLLNVARRLVDGEQVLVGVAAPAGAPGTGSAQAAGLLDLNAASASDLDALPGIGPVLAQRIVDWRTENGRFASVDQLREVNGIGEAKYSDLQAKVTV